MLDYPRFFSRGDVAAIRCLFWWGNHFSIHLVLGGKYRQLFGQKVKGAIASGRLSGWYLGVAGDPWQHHFESDNYEKIVTGQDMPGDSYIKVARWLSLSEWENAEHFFLECYNTLINILIDYQ
jgi:hypothetical protein